MFQVDEVTKGIHVYGGIVDHDNPVLLLCDGVSVSLSGDDLLGTLSTAVEPGDSSLSG